MLLRKWINSSYTEKVWQQRYTRYASTIYLAVVLSYFAVSFRSAHSGNCNECWVRETFETCFPSGSDSKIGPTRKELRTLPRWAQVQAAPASAFFQRFLPAAQVS